MSTPEEEQAEAKFEEWYKNRQRTELIKWIELWLPELNPIQINLLIAKIDVLME